MAIGSCGSGKNDDCDNGQWHQLLCCDMEDYHWQECTEYKSDHGKDLSCPDLLNYNGAILEGACGSGMWSDCQGETHIVSNQYGVKFLYMLKLCVMLQY